MLKSSIGAALVCKICDGKLSRVLLTIRKPDRFERHVGIPEKGYRRDWIQCEQCSAATDVHDLRTRAKLKQVENAYYAVDFQSSSLEEKYRKVMALPPERSDNTQRVQRIHSFCSEWFGRYFDIQKVRTVLDIGAGLGVFLDRFLELAETKWKAVAIESDPLACRHLRSLKKFRVVEEIFPGKTSIADFDLITLNKVVEHIQNPIPFLKKIARALSKKTGICYLELPDTLTFGNRPSTDNIVGALHHHLYNPRSITILLENSGFVPIQIMRFFEPSGKITVAAFATLPRVSSSLARKYFSG